MALCGNESIFFTYIPQVSKSFSGRQIHEQITSGFMTITRSPQRNAVLKRQTLTTPSTPQPQQKSNFKSLPPEFDPRKPPPNWREPTPSTVPAPPGFEQHSPKATNDQQKPRRRRRHKKGNSDLFEMLNETDETLGVDDDLLKEA
jgi:hypothetical protein